MSTGFTWILIFNTESFFFSSNPFLHFHLDFLVFLVSLFVLLSFFSLLHCAALKGSFPIYGQYGRSDVSCVLSEFATVMYVTVLFFCFFMFGQVHVNMISVAVSAA